MRTRHGTALRLVLGGKTQATIPPSDAAIIEAFASGDRRTAELVYERLIGVVDAALYRVIGRREVDHDDLVQASFEQIILTLSKQRFAGGCSLNGWAASIACHVGLNALRSRTRARRVFVLEADAAVEGAIRSSPHDIEAQVEARREIARMRAHLARMSEDRSHTVLLHDVFGLSLAETARLTKATMTATQTRLVRGRRELRERMAEGEAES